MEADGPGMERRAIFVLGMHRSGTSALTRVLNLLGCDLAESLVEADRYNERGYWEAPEIAELNDEILAAAGTTWSGWAPLDPGWADSGGVDFEARAAGLLDRLFAGKRMFVVKDPRICLLYPLWAAAAKRSGARVCSVLALRPPIEVAVSLLRRNGMNPSIAQLVWLRYMLEAEHHSRGRPRLVVGYEDLLRDWRAAADAIGRALEVDWPREIEDAAPEIDGFLSPDLRHHAAGDEETLLSSARIEAPWFSDTMTALGNGAVDPRDRDRLDAVRAEFDAAALAFRRPVDELSAHGVYLKDMADRLAEERDSARKERNAARNEAEAARCTAEAAQTALESADRQAALLHTLFGEAARSLKVAVAETEALAVRLATLEQSLSWRVTAPYRRLRAELHRLKLRVAPTPLGRRLMAGKRRARQVAIRYARRP